MASSLFGTPYQTPFQTPTQIAPQVPVVNNQETGILGRLTAAKQAMAMLKGLGNKNAMTNALLSRNPQIQQFIQSGGDPRAAFYAMAQEKGVDPESILEPLRAMMK